MCEKYCTQTSIHPSELRASAIFRLYSSRQVPENQATDVLNNGSSVPFCFYQVQLFISDQVSLSKSEIHNVFLKYSSLLTFGAIRVHTAFPSKLAWFSA